VKSPALAADKFATDVLNASLTLMSILVAVIVVLAVEYKHAESDATLAGAIYPCVIATTGASVAAGIIAVLALLHLRLGVVPVNLLVWFFAILIVAMVIGVVWIEHVLVG